MTEFDGMDFSGSMGAEEAQEASKSAGGDFGRRLDYLNLDGSKEGQAAGKDEAIVRFVNDMGRRRPEEPVSQYDLPWINALQHYAPTKPKPDWVKEETNWPSKKFIGCRKDKIFVKKYGGDCYICDVVKNIPKPRTFALAVERERVLDNEGRVLGFRDKVREVPVEGPDGRWVKKEGTQNEFETEIVPAFIVLSQGWKNFFGTLQSQASYYQNTVLDAEWLIKRNGVGTDTSYNFIRIAESPVVEKVGSLEPGEKLDLGAPGVLEGLYGEYLPDLRRIVAAEVEDDKINRYFVPGWTPPDKQGEKGSSGSQGGDQQGYKPPAQSQAPAPTPPAPQGGSVGLSADAGEALRSRILGKTS